MDVSKSGYCDQSQQFYAYKNSFASSLVDECKYIMRDWVPEKVNLLKSNICREIILAGRVIKKNKVATAMFIGGSLTTFAHFTALCAIVVSTIALPVITSSMLVSALSLVVFGVTVPYLLLSLTVPSTVTILAGDSLRQTYRELR